LGHPADPILNVLKDSLLIDKKDNTACCEICQRAKQTREPFPLSDHTCKRAVWVYLIKSKDEVPHFITVFYNLIENQFKRKIKVFRSDNGTEFVHQTVTKLCSDKEIIHQTSCVYTPQQNGIVERKHRHLLNVARSLMFQRGIPLKMWTECILTATYLINRLPSSVLNGKSPYAMIYKKYVNHINFFDIEYPEIPNDDERVANDLNKDKSESISSSVSGSNINTADFSVDSENDADSSDGLVAIQSEEVATLEENIFSKGNLDKNPSLSQGVQNVRRSSRQSVFPRNYNDFIVESKVKYGIEKYVGYSKLNSERYCFITQLNKTKEPKSYVEASNYPHWTDAMNQEMDALLRNGTWEMVQLPEGRKAIGSKWIYKIKFRSSDEIDRYKARLVAQGSIPINKGLIQAIPTSLPSQPIGEETKASNLQRIPPGVQGRSHFTYFLYLIVQIRILELRIISFNMSNTEQPESTVNKYLTRVRDDSGPRVVRPLIEENIKFEFWGQCIDELKGNVFLGNNDENPLEDISNITSIVNLF
ncbi:ribonuclease H-like domain-containing protein, partial [Tanacetum coccineum]